MFLADNDTSRTFFFFRIELDIVRKSSPKVLATKIGVLFTAVVVRSVYV